LLEDFEICDSNAIQDKGKRYLSEKPFMDSLVSPYFSRIKSLGFTSRSRPTHTSLDKRLIEANPCALSN